MRGRKAQRSVRSVRIVRGLTLRRVQFTDRILHLIRGLRKKAPFHDSMGAEGLTIRSIRTDGKVPLRSVEYSSRIADCISLGRLKKKLTSLMIVWGAEGLTIRSIRTDG